MDSPHKANPANYKILTETNLLYKCTVRRRLINNLFVYRILLYMVRQLSMNDFKPYLFPDGLGNPSSASFLQQNFCWPKSVFLHINTAESLQNHYYMNIALVFVIRNQYKMY